MPNRLFLPALFGAALTAAAGASAADAVALSQPAGAKARAGGSALLSVPTHAGVEAFWVDAPEGADSDARRDHAEQAPFHAGRAPDPTPGYVLHARVIVRTGDGDALALVAGALTAGAAKVARADPTGAGLRGFWLVECASVSQAAALAGALRGRGGIAEAYVDVERPLALRTVPTDPGFGQQWYLHNTSIPVNDANLMPAWKAGYTGAGVIVAITEFGWNTTHPDLAAKFNADASQAGAGTNDHGTAVAGIVGMIANNGIGGAGAAYGAGLSRLFISGGSVGVAAAFGFRNDLNFVKNNSWGPSDNGLVTTMTSLERTALEDAIQDGRNGLGTVFVWAAGNGGAGIDRVDYDPYASSRYTIAVGAIDSLDRRSSYSEPGASLLLVAQSDGDMGVYSTAGASGYTTIFGGTSASSPLAAGVAAVVLEANPALNWRDVQHVLVRSARKCRPGDASWRVNGAGLNISDLFGLGAIDAGAGAALAVDWPGVAEEFHHLTPVQEEMAAIPDNNAGGVVRTMIVPASMRIESVELVLTAAHSACGQLRVRLESPSGTEALLANTRSDNNNAYGPGYLFTSMQHFGERAMGTWTLRVADTAAGTTGTLVSWQLRLHGTEVACPCDWDGDGDRDVPDIFAFLASWFAGAADFDLDGTTGVPDVFAFLGCWFGTCP